MNIDQSAAIARLVRKRIRLSALAGIGGLLFSLIVMALLGQGAIWLIGLISRIGIGGPAVNLSIIAIFALMIIAYPFCGDTESNHMEYDIDRAPAGNEVDRWTIGRRQFASEQLAVNGIFDFLFFAVKLFHIARRQLGNAIVLAATPAGRIESVIGALYRARFGIDLDCLADACELAPDRTAALLRRLDAALLLVRADDDQPAVKLNAAWRDALAAAAGEAEIGSAAPFDES
jgi:hypothetical protein